MVRYVTHAVSLAALVGLASQARAEVRLHHLFSDNVVLQQGVAVPIWGQADPGEKVTVEFRGQKASAIAKDGIWMAKLSPLNAGGPFSLKVVGQNTLELTNVAVGEVWLCSGQSNMEWPLARSFQPEADIQESDDPMLRCFTVPKLKSDAPVNDIQATWQASSPSAVSNFSAVAYYFGRSLRAARRVPVGLIHASWGGSPAEAWMSRAALAASPEYQETILDAFPGAVQRYQVDLLRWSQEKSDWEQAGRKLDRSRPRAPWCPGELYNGMIAPLKPFAIRGAIWYQGEANAERAWQYRRLFPDLIRNWRRDWGQGDFPFLAVQLAPWDRDLKRPLPAITAAPGESTWAELREAQLLAAQTMKNVGLAVITDWGEKDNIHPAHKAPVGERLALLARKIAYRERLVAMGPVFQRQKVEKDKIVLQFGEIGRGLESRDGLVSGFSICGPDRIFVWANARIQKNQVMVHAPEIPHPVAVRYGWADYPVANLFNKEGLPASPFRTDSFPMITAPKQTKF